MDEEWRINKRSSSSHKWGSATQPSNYYIVHRNPQRKLHLCMSSSTKTSKWMGLTSHIDHRSSIINHEPNSNVKYLKITFKNIWRRSLIQLPDYIELSVLLTHICIWALYTLTYASHIAYLNYTFYFEQFSSLTT